MSESKMINSLARLKSMSSSGQNTYRSLTKNVETLLIFVKKTLPLLSWNARSRIFDHQNYFVADHFGTNPDETLFDKFGRVPTQVQHDLVQSKPIAHYNKVIRAEHLDLHLRVAMVEHPADRLEYVVQNVGRSHVHLDLLVGRAMHIKHIAEKVIDELQRILDNGQVIPGALFRLIVDKGRFLVNRRFDERTRSHSSCYWVPNLMRNKI